MLPRPQASLQRAALGLDLGLDGRSCGISATTTTSATRGHRQGPPRHAALLGAGGKQLLLAVGVTAFLLGVLVGQAV